MIFNYLPTDTVTFAGFARGQEAAAVSIRTPLTGTLSGIQITLPDLTTVVFVDVNPRGVTFHL